MSIETEIQALTSAIRDLTAALTREPVTQVKEKPAKAKADAPAPVQSPAMPPLPFPATPVPATAPVTFQTFPPTVTVTQAAPAAVAPFTTTEECVKWTIAKFQALGPKGSEIQKILAGMGIPNLTAIRPEQFGPLFAAVEAIQ